MAEQKILVKIEGSWRELDLYPGSKARANGIANSIEDLSVRKISTTNTLSLPPTSNNINLLKLNRFNHKQTASRINQKHECRITVDEETSVEGFLVVNNLLDDINVNIIDPALDLLELWKTKSFKEILLDDTVVNTLPAEYQTVVNEMKNYFIDPNGLALLSDLLGETYPLARFPNTLNSIGDKFNIKADGERQAATDINTRQCRPVFNVRAFLELAAHCFGYTPNFESDVDLAALQRKYVSPKSAQSAAEDFITISSSLHTPQYMHYQSGSRAETMIRGRDWEADWIYPQNIPNYVDPPSLSGTVPQNRKVVYVPRTDQSFQGDIDCSITFFTNFVIVSKYILVWAMFEGDNPGDDVVYKVLPTGTATPSTANSWNFTIDKDDLAVGPGTGDFIGVIAVAITDSFPTGAGAQMTVNFTPNNYSETYKEADEGIIYTEDLEYELSTNPDLRNEAPEETFRDLLLDIMINQGLMVDIDATNNQVHYYTFNRFRDAAVVDISEYVIQAGNSRLDTDFGNKYGVITEVALKDAFKGNTFKANLVNQGIESKLPAYKLFETKKLKDVEEVLRLSNRFEFTSKSLGLIESSSSISLQQVTINGSPLTTTDIPHVVNFNYGALPAGVEEWFRLVDEGLRVKENFLLPAKVHRALSVRNMYYVEKLGGLVILEEIKEYVDSQTPVEISFIRPNY